MRKITLLFLFTFSAGLIQAQTDDPVVLVVDGKPVYRSEFETVFKKNNKDSVITREALNEYLDMYINFKLKVREAEKLSLDTSRAFINELAGYRRQLAQPYLTDTEVTEQLIAEAYERMKTDVRASHILIQVASDASPRDTMQAWKTINDIRNQVIKGADFAALAREVSHDPSARDNGGDLGYFTSMMMVYPFESAAYATPVGEISQPVRTRFGYHIVKVTDKRPARGKVQVGHIMVSTQNNVNAEDSLTSRKRIFELYEKLKAGGEFEELARQHSDDRSSAAKDGMLPLFGTGFMVPEFEDVAFSIKEKGAVSEPFQTRYGWHIIKKYDQKDLEPLEEMKAEIKNRIARDSRAEKSRESFINRLKKEYTYKENPENFKTLPAKVDTTIFSATWKAAGLEKLTKPLFTLGDTTLYQADFLHYLEANQVIQPKADIQQYTRRRYQEWVDKTVYDYENNRLEKKYPEFRALMQEYRDGMLLFDLTDDMVWSKAFKDTAGLEAFYETVKTNYMWPERVNATIYSASSEDIAKKTDKLLKKADKKGYTAADISKMINKDSALNLRTDSAVFVREDHKVLAVLPWVPGKSPITEIEGQYIIADIHQVLDPAPKTLDEARGLIIAEYQNHLEREWVKQLREKYAVEVNRDNLFTIK